MAALAGFTTDLAHVGLPDGSRPDVLRVDVPGRRLFIGDAKDVETPGNAATHARLARYVAWGVVAAPRSLEVVVAICHGRPAESWQWVGSLVAAMKTAGGQAGTCDVATLDVGLGIACLTLPAATPRPADPHDWFNSLRASPRLVE
jgi:hypothetical protein